MMVLACLLLLHYSDKDKALFMVFDGHGKEGDLCAIYCRDHLPNAVAKVCKSNRYTITLLAHIYCINSTRLVIIGV
jgi:serine/threonine protein phosphatase PrpC